MDIDPLADAVERAGVEIGGGERRNAYLASYLSKDPRLVYIRRRGWWAPELGDPPEQQSPNDPPENTEPPDDLSPEGSGVAGSHMNGPVSSYDADYRMGGGGT
jgi:hypothetical protein